ncbi:MAG: DUF4124 domain-containing protein [Pseudomonas sp.]|uniref:DUF4124 domain-containing protein n=1 Tax=Pseudomonas sp. TaxID=306 RepID=UPI003D0DEF94
MRLMLACLMLALVLPASAQIYKYTDSKGNTVFTNQPPDGTQAENVELPKTNTVQMQAPTVPVEPEPEPESGPFYRTLALTGVPDEGALRANNGTFTVSVSLEPRLAANHRLRLLLDGQPYGQASNVPRLQLTNIDRGEHTLAVEVLSGDTSIQQSATVAFTVQRTSVNSPARAPTPTPRPTP